MDFQDILKVASELQGLNIIPNLGPPKRDPTVKGVQSTAVQAFLQRKEEELRERALEEKKKKEELLKKRMEVKNVKKARAMSRQTKDNFFGYDGTPLEERSKRKPVVGGPRGQGTDQECLKEEEAASLEYCHTGSGHKDSEDNEEEKTLVKSSTIPKVSLKSAPAPMNFRDLLRLAEKNQYEPVQNKVGKKIEERSRTTQELRGTEFCERKHRSPDKGLEHKMLAPPTLSEKVPSSKERISPSVKGPGEKPSYSTGNQLPLIRAEAKSRSNVTREEILRLPSSKYERGETTKAGSGGDSSAHLPREPHSFSLLGAGKLHPSTHSMGTGISKTVARGTPKSKEHKSPKSSSSHPSHSKSGVISAPHDKTRNPGAKQPENCSSSASERPGGGTFRPILKPGFSRNCGSSSSRSALQTIRSKVSSSDSSPTGPSVRGTGGCGYPISNLRNSGQLSSRMGSTGLMGTQLGRPDSGSSGPGRPSSSGPGRPIRVSGGSDKPLCTVVTETSFSKNISSRPKKGMRSPPSGNREAIYPQGPQRSRFPTLSRKRYLVEDDDDEYDWEMEDFIDDEGEPQEDISKHIREIFGYDRNKYKDESDYALRYMESSWREQQKEEAKSLRIGRREDLEEMRREKEELKKRNAKKMKLH